VRSGATPDVRQAVTDVVIRYATAIDRRDWALFRTCFTDDCVADYGAIGRWRGVADLVRFMENVHARCGHSLHRISNQAVSGDAAPFFVRSYVDALVLASDNETGTRSCGWYDDEIVSTKDGWRIATRAFTMVYVTADIGARLVTTSASDL
jgi:hypothetical protein